MHIETLCCVMRCACHENKKHIAELWELYWNGLFSFAELLAVFRGETLYGW